MKEMGVKNLLWVKMRISVYDLNTYFSSIRNKILAALEKAEKTISVAVCWFTDDELFNAICYKLSKGLQVELIILDDDINSRPFGCDFQRFIEKEGIYI